MILSEYALIPDIFDPETYSSRELAAACLSWLKEPLLNEALVRDLRHGEWSAFMKEGLSRWDRVGKELFQKLLKQNRLYPRPPTGEAACSDGESWTREAIRSHQETPLTGIIASNALAEVFRQDGPVGAIEHLTSTQWWQDRTPSRRTPRTTDAYLGLLALLLKRANSLMFIDRFLDPRETRYSRFIELLEQCGRRRPTPTIELHRVCYVGSGRRQDPRPPAEWETAFRSTLEQRLRAAGVQVEVFIWDNFHDRYLVTDLIGVSVTNGFDTTADPQASVTWTRLGRKDRDEVQREFDSSSHRHVLRHQFRVA